MQRRDPYSFFRISAVKAKEKLKAEYNQLNPAELKRKITR